MAWSETPLMWGEPPVGAQIDGRSRFHLPAGTVTFLMSDIEGSTRLWSQAPEAMERAVGESYAILDRAIVRHDGVRPVEQGEGDSTVGAFSRASDAIAAALDVQRELHAHAWPVGAEVRVRIALHTADAQPREDGNYFGLALSRCARLRAIAHGGQTLLSRATRDLVVDRLPDDVELVDCGEHRLRDLGRPEHVFALVHPDFGDAPGPLRSLDTFPNNLPGQLTSFVGRARELAQLREALEETRLLTLTGAGGAGKTRLALQLAADALERFPGGAWLADLAPVADPELVGEVLASALGVRPLQTMSALEAACARLGEQPALVVLDNCEHLLAACAQVTETVLQACPAVVVLATSRAPLGAAGETDWRVPSLSLPVADRPREPLQALEQSDAVRLFIERARKARPNFAVSNDNAPAVAQICQELDGLPLAIELAAARVRMMSAEQIAAGLGDCFHLLTGGRRTALPRQQTLRASVDWSHELLSTPEQTLLRRLGVFAGGFTLDLAEAGCAGDGLERVAILDLLASLVDKSLVVADERPGAVRYRLLETVRQYALERMNEAGEARAMRDRHRDALLELAERIAPELHGPGQGAWLDVLDQDAANLAAAIEHAADSDPERALRLCVALTFWWKGRGLFDPAERGFARALEAGVPEPSALRAHATWGRAYLASYAGRFEAAVAGLQEALAMAEAVGDQRAIGRSLMALGFLLIFTDPAMCRATSERAREVARACGDDWAMIAANLNVASSQSLRHELADARRVLDDTHALAEQHGYLELQAWHWGWGAWASWLAADRARLSDKAGRALAFARAGGEPTTEAFAQGMLAEHEIAAGDPQAALDRLQVTYDRVLLAGAGLALGYTVAWLSMAQAALGNLAGARAALEGVIATGMDQGSLLAFATVRLADVLRVAGDPVAARARAEAGLAIAERAAIPITIALAKEMLGRLAAAQGEWTRAETLLHEALTIQAEGGMHLWLAQTLDGLAEVAVGLESNVEAARMLGIAQRSRAGHGLVRPPGDVPHFAALEAQLREALGDDAYELAHREGEELTLEEAVTWLRGARGERRRPARGWESLTPTELRVVALVADGLTNPQIGARMFISPGTVKAHLSHIFAKLAVGSRAELAAEATRRALAPSPPTGL